MTHVSIIAIEMHLNNCDAKKLGVISVEELKSRGVEFVSDVLEFPWGYVAQFQDPDGNRLPIREGR